MMRPRLIFIGPCHKFDPRGRRPFPPFSEQSRSGAFLRRAVGSAGVQDVASVEFTNILPGPLFDPKGEERYPHWRELLAALDEHAIWNTSKSDVLIALGGAVERALVTASSTRLSRGEDVARVVALPHPSYMMRRPKAEREQFTRTLIRTMTAVLRRGELR